MAEKLGIDGIGAGDMAAYFDMEFCNECISRHNIPVAIGVSYRRGNREIGYYHALIWCGDQYKLWREQLSHIGYSQEMLQQHGKPMEEVTEEMLDRHREYQPKAYISLGKQDENLLKKHFTQMIRGWNFCDAIKFLPKRLSLKSDISLEKYAYICRMEFIHQYDPLEDARALADVIWRVLHHQVDEARRQEVEREYNRKLFLARYRNKQQAYAYLLGRPQPTPGQQEKLKNHRAFLEKNKEKYLAYLNFDA